jgi:large subunit ribosomal protein L32
MAAVPKKKLTRRRRDNRRAHIRIQLPALVICPQCREYRRAHHVCPHCGTYRGRQVLEIKGAASEQAGG